MKKLIFSKRKKLKSKKESGWQKQKKFCYISGWWGDNVWASLIWLIIEQEIVATKRAQSDTIASKECKKADACQLVVDEMEGLGELLPTVAELEKDLWEKEWDINKAISRKTVCGCRAIWSECRYPWEVITCWEKQTTCGIAAQQGVLARTCHCIISTKNVETCNGANTRQTDPSPCFCYSYTLADRQFRTLCPLSQKFSYEEYPWPG